MMKGKLPVRSKSSNLVAKLLDNPQLPAYIPTLTGPALTKLVRYVGKEDAQELLVYATPQQITDLIEVDTWVSPHPGAEETFAPQKFLEWLELWRDMDAAFLTEKLQNVGSQLFARMLHRFVVVVDIHEVGVSGSMDTFGNLGVIPKEDEHWPSIFRLLTDVWDEDAEFLGEALAYCCQRRSWVTEKTYITDNENLVPDVDGERDRHRREQGYVTSLSAGAFLGGIRESALPDLLLQTAYDPYSALQLSRSRIKAVTDAMKTKSSFDKSDGLTEASCVESAPNDAAKSQRAELEALLEPVLREDVQARVLRLSGPAPNESLYLEGKLRLLGENSPGELEQRYRELVYLANVLMEGCAVQGKRLTESEATTCAQRLCNLGLLYCVIEAPWDTEKNILKELLEREPGLMKTFSIGYRLISDIPNKVYHALGRVLLADKTQRRLQKDPWLHEMVREEFSLLRLGRLISKRQNRHFNALLDSLLYCFEASACEQLRIVGDTLPRFPNVLDGKVRDSIYVDKSWRFIAAPDDIHVIRHFLDNLETALF